MVWLVYETQQTQNTVVELAGESSEVILFGAHLDGVQAGPGINDNGSGSSTLLEIAKQLQPCAPTRTVRFDPLHFRSDYVACFSVGIPFADISTGADGIKSQSEVNRFGGQFGEQHDECYHRPCDNIDNVDMDALEVMFKSIARSVQHFGVEGQGL